MDRTYCVKCGQFVEPYVREEPEYIPEIKRSVMQTRYRCSGCMSEVSTVDLRWKNLERHVLGLRYAMKAMYIGTENGPVEVFNSDSPNADPVEVVRRYREMLQSPKRSLVL